uniref:Uncharacterized protein n=1 Tax=Glossina austeni TaxID=7395 RepID=A0A1A9VG77_GLOAU
MYISLVIINALKCNDNSVAKDGGGCDAGVDTTTDDCCCCAVVAANGTAQLALVSVSFIFKAACNGAAVVGGGAGNVLDEVKATLDGEGLGCKNVLTSGIVAFVLALRRDGDIDFSLVALLASFLLCFKGGSIKVLPQATELRLLFLSSFSTLSADLSPSLSLVDLTVFVLAALFLEDSCLTFVDFTVWTLEVVTVAAAIVGFVVVTDAAMHTLLWLVLSLVCLVFGPAPFKSCLSSVESTFEVLSRFLLFATSGLVPLELAVVAAVMIDLEAFSICSTLAVAAAVTSTGFCGLYLLLPEELESFLDSLDLEDNGFPTVALKSGECLTDDSEVGVVIEFVPLVIGVPKRLVNVGNFASSERDLCFLISVTARVAMADVTIVAPTVPGTTPDTGTPPPLSNFKRNSSDGLSNINFSIFIFA